MSSYQTSCKSFWKGSWSDHLANNALISIKVGSPSMLLSLVWQSHCGVWIDSFLYKNNDEALEYFAQFSLNFLTWCQNLLSSCHLLDARAGGAKPSINHNIMFLQSPQIIDFLWVTAALPKMTLASAGLSKNGFEPKRLMFFKAFEFHFRYCKKDYSELP